MADFVFLHELIFYKSFEYESFISVLLNNSNVAFDVM